MNEPIESQGKTVEEAISEALLQLGARRNEVEVKVLDEGKSGFLGMFGNKPARVLVRRKQRSRGRRQGSTLGRSESSSRRSKKKTAPGKPPNIKREGRSSSASAADSTRKQERRSQKPEHRPDRGPEHHPQPAANNVPVGDEVKAVSRVKPMRGVAPEKSAENLYEITSQLMRLSDFPCRCEVKEGEYHLVKIVTDDTSAGVLIGRHGTTVDAVEHLIERMASQACGERVSMNLDVNNYRRRREENLVQRVQEIVQKVNSTGREVHMEPLCARERRIVHLEVVNIPGLRTYTIADSSGKHVVVAKGEPGTGSLEPGGQESDAREPDSRENDPREKGSNQHTTGGDSAVETAADI